MFELPKPITKTTIEEWLIEEYIDATCRKVPQSLINNKINSLYFFSDDVYSKISGRSSTFARILRPAGIAKIPDPTILGDYLYERSQEEE